MSDIATIPETHETKAHFYKTSSGNKGELIIKENLPVELVVHEILTRVSTDSWDKILKYICKSWFAIPRDPVFIKLQLNHCKLGLYIQGFINSETQFIEIQDMKARVMFKRSIPREICDSHDGLLLIRIFKNKDTTTVDYYAANPATKQVVKLAFDFQENVHYLKPKIVGSGTDGKLKVVFFATVPSQERLQHCWYIYAIHGGTYRKVSCPDSIEIKEPFYPSSTISIGAVTYWIDEDIEQTLVFDVNHETCHSLVLPEDTKKVDGRRHWQLVRNGDHLGFISWTAKAREINMWILKDLQNNEWIKTGKIVASGRSSVLSRGLIRSAIYLHDQQILVFLVNVLLRSLSLRLVAFDLRTGRVRTMTMKKMHVFSHVGLHINSLVSL